MATLNVYAADVRVGDQITAGLPDGGVITVTTLQIVQGGPGLLALIGHAGGSRLLAAGVMLTVTRDGVGVPDTPYDPFPMYLTEAEARAASVSAGREVFVQRDGAPYLGSTVGSDEFTGSSLDRSIWSVVREDSTGLRVQGGALELNPGAGALDNANNTLKNIVGQRIPAGSWVAETKVNLPLGAEFDQGGMILYAGDDTYALLSLVARPSNVGRLQMRWEPASNFIRATTADYSDAARSSYPADVWFRLVCDGTQVIGYYSPDGTVWTQVGRPVPLDGFRNAHVGVYASNTTAMIARFEYFRIQHEGSYLGGTVVPPDFGSLSRGAPSGSLATTLLGLVRNSDKYLLNTWYPGAYGSQSGQPYIDFGGALDEAHYRPPAMAANTLAWSLTTGSYSQSVTGVTPGAARAIVVRLVSSLAHSHRATTMGGWGDDWQGTLWTAHVAQAGWLVWDSLTDADRIAVSRMTAREADRVATLVLPYWTNLAGVVQTPGDTKAEELSWHSTIVQIACAMMPRHPRWLTWMRRNIQLLVSAYARPSDATNPTLMAGVPVRDWINGWNAYENGTVENHTVNPHPNYSASIATSLHAAITASLAGGDTPKACTHNADVVWRAMVDLPFAAPPFASPGGTIYIPGSDAVYYPSGADGSTLRRANYLAFDVMANTLGVDRTSNNGAYWAPLHASGAVALQARFTTGATYGPDDDEQGPTREQWAAWHYGMAWLMLWLTQQGAISISNAPVDQLARTGFAGPRTASTVAALPAPVTATDPALTSLPMLAGLYYTPPRSATTSGYGAGNGNLRGSRVTVARDCLLNSLAVKVATAGSAGSLLRLAVYEMNPATQAWALLLDAGTVDCTSTGVKTLTVALPLSAGRTYAVVAAGQGAPTTAPLLQGTSTTQVAAIGDTSADSILSNAPTGIGTTGVTAAAPSSPTFGLVTSIPLIAMRAA